MKHIHITLTDENYGKLKEKKERRGLTWRELLLSSNKGRDNSGNPHK